DPEPETDVVLERVVDIPLVPAGHAVGADISEAATGDDIPVGCDTVLGRAVGGSPALLAIRAIANAKVCHRRLLSNGCCRARNSWLATTGESLRGLEHRRALLRRPRR